MVNKLYNSFGKEDERFKLTSKNPFEVLNDLENNLYILVEIKPKDIDINEISNRFKEYKRKYSDILEGSYKHLLTAFLVAYRFSPQGTYVKGYAKVFFPILNQIIEKTYNSKDKEFYIATIDLFGNTTKDKRCGESIIATLDYGKTFHILREGIDYKVTNYNSKKHENHVEIELLSKKYHNCVELKLW